jgi:hypothetical protein
LGRVGIPRGKSSNPKEAIEADSAASNRNIMAKSKQSQQMAQALVAAAATLAKIQQLLVKDSTIVPDMKNTFDKQIRAANDAHYKLGMHLVDLEKRESNSNVLLKLRNAKNAFKNKEDLKKQRLRALERCEKVGQHVHLMMAAASDMNKGGDPARVAEAVKKCLLEIRQAEIEVRNFDQQAETIEEVLA